MIKNFNKKNILLIDDDDNVHTLLKLYLEGSKSNLISAKSGCDGITKFITNKIDLIILDVNMPNMNGFETLVKLKEINSNIDVIMCTGNTEFKDKVYSAGAIAYILKPIEKNKLLHVIDMVFKLQSVE
jgi:DNA-binding response OmpR family regulator